MSVAANLLTFGVNFNSADNDVYQTFVNTANVYFGFHGEREFSSVAAGTYTFTLKVKVGGGTWNIDTNGQLNMTVEEVFTT
jgi:hypothetical protein